MFRLMLLVTFLLGVLSVAVAQPDPNQAQTQLPAQMPAIRLSVSRPDASNTAMILTHDGLFILHGGILAKFDTRTLKAEGTLTLIEQPTMTPQVIGGPGPVVQPLAPQGGVGAGVNITINGVAIGAPAGGAAAPNIMIAPIQPGAGAPTTMTQMQQWQTTQQRWNAAPALLDAGDALLAVQYDKVFRVDPKALTLAASCDLTTANNPANGVINYIVSNQQTMATLDTGTLFITRGSDLWSVDATTLKVLGQATLPQPAGAQPGATPPIRIQPTPDGMAALNQAAAVLNQLQQQVIGAPAGGQGQAGAVVQPPPIQ